MKMLIFKLFVRNLFRMDIDSKIQREVGKLSEDELLSSISKLLK